MTSTQFTKSEMKELLRDFSETHQKRFDNVDKQLALFDRMFRALDNKFGSVHSDIKAMQELHAEMTESMENVEEKLDYLLFNPKLKELERVNSNKGTKYDIGFPQSPDFMIVTDDFPPPKFGPQFVGRIWGAGF